MRNLFRKIVNEVTGAELCGSILNYNSLLMLLSTGSTTWKYMMEAFVVNFRQLPKIAPKMTLKIDKQPIYNTPPSFLGVLQLHSSLRFLCARYVTRRKRKRIWRRKTRYCKRVRFIRRICTILWYQHYTSTTCYLWNNLYNSSSHFQHKLLPQCSCFTIRSHRDNTSSPASRESGVRRVKTEVTTRQITATLYRSSKLVQRQNSWTWRNNVRRSIAENQGD